MQISANPSILALAALFFIGCSKPSNSTTDYNIPPQVISNKPSFPHGVEPANNPSMQGSRAELMTSIFNAITPKAHATPYTGFIPPEKFTLTSGFRSSGSSGITLLNNGTLFNGNYQEAQQEGYLQSDPFSPDSKKFKNDEEIVFKFGDENDSDFFKHANESNDEPHFIMSDDDSKALDRKK